MKQNTMDDTNGLKLNDGGRPRRSAGTIATSALMASLVMIPLAACSSSGNSTNASGGSEGGNSGPVTVKNCGKDATYPSAAKHMYVNDGNMIATTLAVGAVDNIANVSSLQDDKAILEAKYGKDVVDKLKVDAPESPSLERIIATKPDLVFAGWNYGFSESKNLTPDALKDHGIESYILSESCRQGESDKRGTMDPWDAAKTDLTNIGKLTGHDDKAKDVVKDVDKRLDALKQAPAAGGSGKAPVTFVFDSAKDTIFTSGKFGGPQAIIEAGGGKNATDDVDDTWTTVGWEKIASAQPDVIAFVDYPSQTFEEKMKVLESNPATKNLEAVKQKRFVNLPYALWTSGPLNIDAAEYMRKAYEKFGLVPETDIHTDVQLPDSLAGREYFVEK